jgi:phosphatidylcholine synthase
MRRPDPCRRGRAIAGQQPSHPATNESGDRASPSAAPTPLVGDPQMARRATRRQRLAAYLVHVYTAAGVVFALLAVVELTRANPDPRWVFGWLAVALFIDASDGALARAAHVKSRLPQIDGRAIDDLVDYLTFTFIPLLLVWRMGWLPFAGADGAPIDPSLAWVSPALIASLFGFANTGAKDEHDGFFLGFPSYWNLYAWYAGFWSTHGAMWLSATLLVVFTVLTVVPVRFIYPNLAPGRWRGPLLVGAAIWAVALLGMLPWYPDGPAWLMWASLAYPAAYFAASGWLDVRSRKK